MRGGKLVMMRMPGGTRSDAACAVARFAAASDATRVLVEELRMDQGEPPCSKLIAAALRDIGQQLTVVEIASDDNLRLFPRTEAAGVLGRSRAGGGGKVLRWAAFLKAADDLDEPARPIPPASQLPPPLAAPRFDRTAGMPGAEAAAAVELPSVDTHWAERMLASWGGEVSETTALRLATEAGRLAARSTDIGEWAHSTTAADEDNSEIARPSRLSPFLRWGVISAREAAHLGVRRRDLLWRDWSHLCWSLLSPLRRGEPVVPPLDGSCLRAAAHPATPVHMSVVSEREAFEAWCVGRTGAPLVDAGMRQLWVEGWMPRRVRLLCACCLTEGMGIDWRLGRDWFALTLIDHDPAINEMMWQNAGLCGVDPFYVGLRWEEGPDEEAEGGSAGGMAAAAQEATMPSQEWAWTAYVRRWVKDSEMRWPPHLRAAASRPRPSLEQASQAAEARRRALRPTHKLANLVGRTGVRVDVRGAGANAEGSGEVLGVGKLSLAELEERLRRPAPTRGESRGARGKSHASSVDM